MVRHAAVAVALAALGAAGCSSPSRPSAPTPECKYNSDCPTGSVCLPGGTCARECLATRDCVTGWACRSGVCVDSRSCSIAADCPNAGDTCTNGFCSTPCTVTNTCPVGPFDTLVNRPSVRISAAGGSIWTTTTDGGAARYASGSATIYGASEGQLSGTAASVALENGGPVTGLTYPGAGSTLTSVTGPVGLLSATWPGGTVTGWTGLDRVTGTIAKTGGVLASASVQDATRLASTTDGKYYLKAASLTDGRFTVSSIGTDTGYVTAVTATTVTTSATLVPDALVGKVLVGRSDQEASNQTRSAQITGNTANTITVQAGGTDLTSLLTVGRRWFAVNNSYPLYYPTYTVAAATPATNGQVLDCYAAGAALWDSNAEYYRNYYGAWTVANATASTFQITAPLTRWAMFADVPARGFCLLGGVVNGVGAVSITVTDPDGAFDPLQAGTLDRILVEGNTLLMPIVSTTPTSVTFAAPAGSVADHGVGQTFRLGSSSAGAVRVTVSPVSGAVVGQYLHVDTAGYRYLVRAVNGPAATIDVSPSYATFPLNWIGSWAAPSATGAALPALTVTDPTFTTAGALAGQGIVVVDAQSPIRYSSSYRLAGVGVVTANDAAGAITLALATCNGPTYSCQHRLRNLLGGLPGLRWQTGHPGSSSYSYPTGYYPYDAAAHFTATLTPSPGWVQDALAGTTLHLDGFAGSGTVQGNDASSALVQVPDASFTAFDTAVPGVGLLAAGSGTSTRITVTDATAAMAADAWRGYDLVNAGGSVVGPVLANGATTLEIGVTSTSALAQLAAGSRYALSRPSGSSSSSSFCYSYGYIEVTAQLAGATLAASSYDALSVTGGSALRVTGNTAAQLSLAICPSDFSSLLQGLGKPAAASALDALTLRLADSGGALASAVGKRIVFFGNASGSYSPVTTAAVTAADASGATLSSTGAGALGFAAGTGVGARFALADAAGIPVAVSATLPAAATAADHELQGRFVTLLLPGSSSTSYRVVRVRDNGSGSVVASLDPADARMLSGETAYAPRFLLTSPGGVVRVAVQGGGLTAGALVGRQLLARMPDYSSLAFEILDNTATEIVAAYQNSFTAVAALGAPAWLVPGLSVGSQAQNALAALPSGEALVGAQTAGPEVWRLGGTTAVTTRLGSGTRLVVTPAAVTTGAVPATTSAVLPVLSSAGWSFTPGALRGGRLITRPSGTGDWMAFAIVDNDASTLTLRNTYGYTLTQGTPFTIETGDLAVSGATLTPGALAGRTLWSGGIAYRIRSNGASTIRVALDASSGYSLQQGLYYAYTPLPPGAGPTPAYVLSGLAGSTLYALAVDGAGFWAGTDVGLAHFDGAAWTQLGDADTSTQVATGTITGYGATYDTVVDAAASYGTNALQAKRLVTPAGVFTIQSNTAKELRLSSYTDAAFPVVGESYRVVESDGLATVYDLAVTGGAVLAGTSRGLARYQSSAFTFWTPANTESAPGKNDGLRGYVYRLAASSPTDAWLETYGQRAVVHWNGTTWTAYTVASTESSYARGDGLPSDSVSGFFLQDASTTWFATGAGAARLAGTTWTQYGAAGGYPTTVSSVHVDGSGAVHLATSVGLIRLR